MQRPTVDVVVPFKGSAEALEQLRTRLAALELQSGDSVLVVDNTPGAGSARADGVAVLNAAGRETPAYARNRGAERGSADWLVFLDADTEPRPDLLDRYFDPPPGARTGLIGGGVSDEPAPGDASAVARYAYLRQAMSQEDTFSFGEWGYPKTANVACRREAFEEIGGFREEIRAAEDADLTFRLRAAGWEVDRREEASVVHRSRETVRGLVSQQLVHGAGAAWLSKTYPGAMPARSWPGFVWWGIRTLARGLAGAVRWRDRDRLLFALLEPLEFFAFELGRALPNHRPLLRRRG